MNRDKILEKYDNENKIFVANIIDKIRMAKTRNQIVATDFLDMYKIKIVQEVLKNYNEENFIFYKRYEELEKNILIIYPLKYRKLFENNYFNYADIIKVIRINLSNELIGKFSHKDYLSGVMKLGIKREKVGDIIVTKYGADIIVKSEICDYIYQNLKLLTRFNKANFEIVNIDKLTKPQIEKKIRRITVTSLRIDNVICEIINCSRNEADDFVKEQRVFINYEITNKSSKIIQERDIIVVRGKGKFKIAEIQGETKKGKISIIFEHYI